MMYHAILIYLFICKAISNNAGSCWVKLINALSLSYKGLEVPVLVQHGFEFLLYSQNIEGCEERKNEEKDIYKVEVGRVGEK